MFPDAAPAARISASSCGAGQTKSDGRPTSLLRAKRAAAAALREARPTLTVSAKHSSRMASISPSVQTGAQRGCVCSSFTTRFHTSLFGDEATKNGPSLLFTSPFFEPSTR